MIPRRLKHLVPLRYRPPLARQLNNLQGVMIIAAAYCWRRMMFRTHVIAITGSLGKTTTKELLATVLGQQFPTVATLKNSNTRNNLGVERNLLRIRPWHRYAIIELGVRDPGDMKHAAKFVKPDIALLLNVAGCHTDNFRTLEKMCAEKAQIFHYTRKNGMAVINDDDELVRSIQLPGTLKKLMFGRQQTQSFEIIDTKCDWPQPLKLVLRCSEGIIEVPTQLYGQHWCNALIAVITLARHFNVPWSQIRSGISATPPYQARMSPVELPSHGAIFLRDDYNNTLTSLDAAIELLKSITGSRRIFVFGDISGSSRSYRGRAQLLGKRAATCSEIAIAVGPYAKFGQRGAILGGLDPANTFEFADFRKTSNFLKHFLKKNDVVYVRGRLNQHLERIILSLFDTVACDVETCNISTSCDNCYWLGFKPAFDSDVYGVKRINYDKTTTYSR